MLLRLYSGLSGSLSEGAERTRELRRAAAAAAAGAGAAAGTAERPGADSYPVFRRGNRPAGVGLGARVQKNERALLGGGENMNGAVYISFFQGQLESVLEQVVQLAVQEISKTVGSSLNTLLLETAVKEQENRRLLLQLQSRENRGRANANTADVGGGGSPKNKAGKTAGDERADSGRTKPEQRLHAPGAHSAEPGLSTDTRRLEQRGRVVGRHPVTQHSHTGTPPSVSASSGTTTRCCVTLQPLSVYE